MIKAFFLAGNRFNLVLPVKRRRAMLASTPSRNSRPELIANDGQGVSSGASYNLARTRPDSGTLAQVYKK
jgi:hypothetical protein